VQSSLFCIGQGDGRREDAGEALSPHAVGIAVNAADAGTPAVPEAVLFFSTICSFWSLKVRCNRRPARIKRVTASSVRCGQEYGLRLSRRSLARPSAAWRFRCLYPVLGLIAELSAEVCHGESFAARETDEANEVFCIGNAFKGMARYVLQISPGKV
jgi:hypothetical protein